MIVGRGLVEIKGEREKKRRKERGREGRREGRREGEKGREGRRERWKRCRNKGRKINARLCTNSALHSEYILEFAHWL